MIFRDVQTLDDVEVYKNRLNNNTPGRSEIIQHVTQQIKALGLEKPTVLELCVGPGQLAESLGNALPSINYIGLDFIQPFLDYTEKHFPRRATFVHADLTGDDWPNLVTNAASGRPIDGIVSMQSLHDVGDASQIALIYKRCLPLLGEGGRLINADFITQEGDEANAQPGRLTVSHHLKLLQAAGYTTTGCSLQTAQFGVCFGSK